MVVSQVKRSHPVETSGYPEELQGSEYSILRDEMLWRKYNNILSRGGLEGTNSALRILRIIREAPD